MKMRKEIDIIEMIYEQMNYNYDSDLKFHVQEAQRERDNTRWKITVNVMELYHDLELKVYFGGDTYGRKKTLDRCPECHDPKTEWEWIELKDINSFEHLVEKLREKTERY